jgi:RNA polymerase-binding protein DksA
MLDSMQGHLRKLITARRAVLADEISAKLAQARAEHVAPDGATAVDGGERASLATYESIDLAEADRDRRELAELDAALARLDDGRFGLCVDCGAEIPIARLLAYPPAARCKSCQEALER